MGHDEARKLWEVYDGCSKEIQAEYMNENYGDQAYDSSREYSEERIAKEIENLINKRISEEHDVKKEEMTLEKAKESGAIGLFDAKYDDIVFVYTIDNISKEICLGPHVENISELGHFKIKKDNLFQQG